MFNIRVPATTANMGPGFDSVGMAFKLYNNISFEEIESGLEIEIKNKSMSDIIPADSDNLIYKSIKQFYDNIGKKIPGIKIIQDDNIPLTRGLGSSAACIVAGLLAGNKLSGQNLSRKEIAQMAAVIEGHPDNSTPAIFGGIVVGAIDDGNLKYVKLDVSNKLQFNVMIPDFHLSTEKARKVIPDKVDLKDAIFNISRASLMIASFLTGNFDNLDTAMQDKLHQPYRMPIIHNMDKIFDMSKKLGAKSVFLSGAGPTIIAVTYNNNSFKSDMSKYLETLDNKWSFNILEPDSDGAVITEI